MYKTMSKQVLLKKQAIKIQKKILNAKINKNYFIYPFDHIIIDNILNEKFAKKVAKSFPDINKKNWEYSNTKDIEVKYRSKWKSEFDIPENVIDLVRILNSSIILDSLSKKIGIKKIIPDPYFSGGGLNITENGGLLDVHIDGNYHDASGLNRRLNLLIYFCKNWKSKYGGELCFYDRNGRKKKKKIEPIFNRMVVFNTHDFSYHGLPNKVKFPKKNPRKSLILYYYTKEKRPKKFTKFSKPHNALWIKKNNKDKKGKLTRSFY